MQHIRSFHCVPPATGIRNGNHYSYLHNLIAVQCPRSPRSLSVVTLARPPKSSSLKITDRFFRYASPCLWNQPPICLRQPHSGTSSSRLHFRLTYSFTHHFFLFWLCVTPSLIHSRLKTYTFHISYPLYCNFIFSSQAAFTDFCPHIFLS